MLLHQRRKKPSSKKIRGIIFRIPEDSTVAVMDESVIERLKRTLRYFAKEHNLASPKLYSPPSQKQQTLTTTCPNGLLPDANGNCPPTPNTATNQQGGLTLNNNNNPQQGHHHKESNNQPTQTGGGGGQKSTLTKTQRIKNRSRNSNTVSILE